MGRLLFWLVLGFVFWFAVRLLLYTRKGVSKERSQSKTKKAAREAQIPMLQCAYCGVHFAAAEAVTTPDGRVFCTQQHERLAHYPAEPS